MGVFWEKVSLSLQPNHPFYSFPLKKKKKNVYVGKGAEVNLMNEGCGYVWDRKGGVNQWRWSQWGSGRRLEVPLWCGCAEVAPEHRDREREREDV